MKKPDQEQFVRILVESVGNEIIGAIEDGTIPEGTDGLELRRLLAHGILYNRYLPLKLQEASL